MKLYEAIALGLCPPNTADLFLQVPCPVCRKHEVEVIQEYGLNAIKFKCAKCGADRGNIQGY